VNLGYLAATDAFIRFFNHKQFNKEVNNGRWRAYSKGSIELCEKCSTFVSQERATLVDSPKDVRRLEALKPLNAPSMRERYDAAISKEKRLEAASNPLVSTDEKKTDWKGKSGKQKRQGQDNDSESDDDRKFDEDEEVDMAPKAKSTKKKRKAAVVNEADLKNIQALEEQDEVQEGIVWSDSE
jgi:hypothetical protein